MPAPQAESAFILHTAMPGRASITRVRTNHGGTRASTLVPVQAGRLIDLAAASSCCVAAYLAGFNQVQTRLLPCLAGMTLSCQGSAAAVTVYDMTGKHRCFGTRQVTVPASRLASMSAVLWLLPAQLGVFQTICSFLARLPGCSCHVVLLNVETAALRL